MPTEFFESELSSMSEEQLTDLFEGGVEGTPGANDLAIGKTTNLDDPTQLEELSDEEDLFEDDTKTPEEIKAAKEKAEAKLAKEAEEKAVKEKEEADKNKTPEQLEKEKKEAEEKAAKEKEEKDAEGKEVSAEVKEVLTNTVDYLIKSGTWVDFEGREGLEITPEIYEEIAVEQDKVRLSSQFNELIDSTGLYGKAIISHIQQGGNPDEIIDIFKEQKELQAINTDSEDGKQTVIEKYYKEILGWKDEKVQKHIKRIIADDEVESEFADVNELYSKHYKEQLESVNRDAQEKARKVQESKEKFQSDIKAALEKENTLTPAQRRLVEDSILNFKHDLGNGQRVNDFYLKFAEIQKNPADYIDLVRYVMDKENYKKALEQKVETREAKKAFTFIKGNGAVSKSGTNPDNSRSSGKSQSGTNFSFALKNK